MNPRPTIGIPTQTLQAIDGIPEGLPHSWVMNHRYFVAVNSVGGVPFMIPLLDDEATLRCMYERLDGVFIAGGVDVDPSSYGEERHERCGRTDSARDRTEMLFARWALDEGKPVFGVCRGMQVMNVVRGGTLYQDCEATYSGSAKHDYFPNAGYARDHLAHTIRLQAATRLHRTYAADEIHVNSMHHQAVRELGRELVASAHAPDGMIEAIETEGDAFAVGVQWHPEMLVDSDAGTRRLFTTFVDAAREWRESHTLLTV